MRVTTIQHKDVFEIIKAKGMYKVNKDKTKYLEYAQSYSKMEELMLNYLGVSALPIWCFNTVQGQEPSTNIHWDFYEGKGATITEDSLLIELDINPDDALIMDYYQWTDYMYFSDEGDTESAQIALDHIFKLERADTIQVCIPYITESMILNVYNCNGKLGGYE